MGNFESDQALSRFFHHHMEDSTPTMVISLGESDILGAVRVHIANNRPQYKDRVTSISLATCALSVLIGVPFNTLCDHLEKLADTDSPFPSVIDEPLHGDQGVARGSNRLMEWLRKW